MTIRGVTLCSRLAALFVFLAALVACGGRSTLSDFSLGGAPEPAIDPSSVGADGDGDGGDND